MPKPKFIGAEHVREVDLTQGVEILDTNKTLFVAALNEHAGEDSQPVACKTMEEIFSTFQPKAEVSITDAEGNSKDATLRFQQVSDFSPDAVIDQSEDLKAIQQELLLLKDMLQQLRKNNQLRKTIDSENREILVQGIKAARGVLEETAS